MTDTTNKKEKVDMSNFDWVQLKKDLDAPHGGSVLIETTEEKCKRKIRENPVVPIGCIMTASALIYGLISFRKGDSKTSQLMMRMRIGAQGFTVLALMGGIIMAATKEQQKP